MTVLGNSNIVTQVPAIEMEDLDRCDKPRLNKPFYVILQRLQIGVLFLGALLFLAWCCSYFADHQGSKFKVAKRLGTLKEPEDAETFKALEELTIIKGAQRLVGLKEEAVDKAEHRESEGNGRLPGNVVPYHYNLTLQLFMLPKYNFTTRGNVEIFIECIEPTEVIILHARDLKVESASVALLNETTENKWLNNTTVELDTERQLLLIHLNDTLESKSRYILDIGFYGIINNLSVGLYRSGYIAQDGNTSWIASTQFQPTDARRAFPCFDEPALKATFRLNIVCEKTAVALSNMPQTKTESLDEEWKLVTFMKTPRMSTYTFAIIVGDVQPFKKEKENIIQIWSRHDMIEYGEFAYNVTPIILKYLQEYIEVPFTMPKLDLAAIPNFLHAAMENWGLITFDETALLYDPSKLGMESKVFVTLVLGHELAHQWFGNLVTATWWDNIWLNEGFATYYEYIAVDHLQPEWNIFHLFIATIYEVMESDSLESTRAMASPVQANEVLQSFDEISYLKGGAIVRMLQHFIGEEGFRKGLKNYLWRYSNKNARENDLWQNLNLWNRNTLGIKQVMTSWTSQAGYPLIKIERNYENRTAEVTQKHFVTNLSDDEDEEETTKRQNEKIWSVPVTYTDGSELDWSTKTDFWLASKSDTIKNLTDENTWIIANVQQVGYYRVNYDQDNWNLILEQLIENHTVINVINRAQIINDLLNLARSDEAEYALALNMTKYLFLEEEYLPWKAAFTAFKYLDTMLAKTPGHDEFKEYLITIMTPLYHRLGWSAELDDNDILSKFLRKSILKWTCNYDNPDCVKEALAKFHEWKENSPENQTIPADDLEIVLCTGIARGPTEDWEYMWKRYLKTNFKAEKNTLLKSLACTRETRLLRKLLKRAMNSSSGLDLKDASDVFLYVAGNSYGQDIVYDYFIRHMNEISFRFGSFAFGGGNIVERVTASMNSENEIEELQSILKGRKTSVREIQKSLKLALHRSKSNLHWMRNKYDDVYNWLRENKA
ncbi:thyrotropin-releasing hormone-degrading ectoenzyme [Caerostris darwini]|uniref:Aminopeptidase N n=1 Tax=Caerostris darwini TaxID=1538125 RepID=A0AAV4UU52_9ARAC|nr:thyrotropin-releasing hormone-degrading ectoenzyme [Caerostris darwini]